MAYQTCCPTTHLCLTTTFFSALPMSKSYFRLFSPADLILFCPAKCIHWCFPPVLTPLDYFLVCLDFLLIKCPLKRKIKRAIPKKGTERIIMHYFFFLCSCVLTTPKLFQKGVLQETSLVSLLIVVHTLCWQASDATSSAVWSIEIWF